MAVLVSPFPSAGDFLAGFLSRDWEDLFSSTPAERLGVSLKVVFAAPWEVDEPVSPPCRDNEVTSSGAEDNQVDAPFCTGEKFDSAGILWFNSCSSPSGGVERGIAGAQGEGSYSGGWV
jgi:hypothetical protein